VEFLYSTAEKFLWKFFILARANLVFGIVVKARKIYNGALAGGFARKAPRKPDFTGKRATLRAGTRR